MRFLTGRGKYTADIQLHGQCFAAFARSNMAHARIVSIDTSAAAAMPGVLTVFTGADFAAVGGNPAGWLVRSCGGETMKEPKRRVLAHGKVRQMNPMIVEGQVHGGVAQGIGQALLENTTYDSNGQLITASYMDYTMPRADDLPNYVVDHSCSTPCTHNPLGVKGCGEAGAIGSPPAVVKAVIDAIARSAARAGRPVKHIDMPLSPSRVWAAMNA